MIDEKISEAANQLKLIVEEMSPTHIVSMVSGGNDSATTHFLAEELGLNIDLIIHGKTGCGIPQTSEFVEDYYGKRSCNFAVADAGTAYEDYVLRKGFFGKGISAHAFAYRVLKATPFRKTISKEIRQRKRGIKVLLLNGARSDESENRKKNLLRHRIDPAAKNNIWFNLIHDWSQEDCSEYLSSREVNINPVAKQLCRSGECMCGTMQSDAARAEASVLYPEWGNWINNLEKQVIEKHGFGWGKPFPKQFKNPNQLDMFQPMCKDCTK